MAKLTHHYQWGKPNDEVTKTPPTEAAKALEEEKAPSFDLQWLAFGALLRYQQKEKQLADLLFSVSNAVQTIKDQLKEDMAGLVLHLLKTYFIDSAQSKSHIKATIEALLMQVYPQQDLTLEVNPCDYEYIRQGAVHLQTPYPITIKPTHELPLGGAKISGLGGVVCFDIERQIQELKSSLMAIKSTSNALQDSHA